MNQGRYPIDERDISFVLFEQLQVERLFEQEAFSSLTRDDVEMILQEGFKFAREQIWPTNAAADREGCRFENGTARAPRALAPLYAAYTEGGWMKIAASEEVGGAGMPMAVALALNEALVGANISFSTYPGLTHGVAHIVDRFGSAWMKRVVLPNLYDGVWGGTMCLTEPQAGSAVGDARTSARREGERYLLTGTKIFITAGDHDLTENIVHLVLARTPGAPKGIKGLSLFFVPKRRICEDGALGEANDVTCAGIEEKLGMHASTTCTLNFGDDGRCEGLLLGEEGQGIQIMFHLMNEARIGTGLHGLAAGSVAYQLSRDYAAERIQGVEIDQMRNVDAPRVPISRHPDVKRMLFTNKARVEGMRALLVRAAFLGDLARCHGDAGVRQRSQKLLDLLTPVCKAYCSDVGFEVTVTAIQTFGGAGYTKDHPIEQLLRDVKVASIYEGTNGIQALDLVGRKLAKNAGELFYLLLEEIGTVVRAGVEHPALADLGRGLGKEVDRLKQVTGRIAELGMGGETNKVALVATPYLRLLGNVVVNWLLLEQAVIAHDRLSALLMDKGATTPEQRAVLVREHDEARFFDGKLRTARFSITTLLPENAGIAAGIMGGDAGILEVDV